MRKFDLVPESQSLSQLDLLLAEVLATDAEHERSIAEYDSSAAGEERWRNTHRRQRVATSAWREEVERCRQARRDAST